MARLRKADETLIFGGIIIGQLINSSFTVIRYPNNENTLTGNVSIYCIMEENLTVIQVDAL